MDLLDQPLIKKYFGSGKCPGIGSYVYCSDHSTCTTYRILAAMTEPIKSGERYLNIKMDNDGWFELEAKSPFGVGLHAYQLRLPDAHQKCCEYNKGNHGNTRSGAVIQMCDACAVSFQHQPNAECDHSGLKRYCGKDVYCEACKREISAVLAECCLSVPHDGPCKKPEPKAEKYCLCHEDHPQMARCNYKCRCVACDCGKKPDQVEYIEQFLCWFMDDIGKRNPNGVQWAYGQVKDKLEELVELARQK